MPAWLTDIAATALPGLGNYLAQKATNKANRQMAQEQMAFQERMSNTSWQRAVKDMQAAGINPAVAYSRGGASSPAGAMATMENEVAPALASAKQGALFRSELEAAKASAERAKAEASSAKVGAAYDEAWLAAHGIIQRPDGSVQLDLSHPGIVEKVRAEISSAQSAARLAALQIPGGEVSARVMGSKFGLYSEYLRRGVGAASPLLGGIGGAAIGAFMRKPAQVYNYGRQ